MSAAVKKALAAAAREANAAQAGAGPARGARRGGPHEAAGGAAGGAQGDNVLDQQVLRACSALDHNDTGNGQRLIAHFGDEFLHIREHGFYSWCGSHWDLTGGEEVVTRLAQETAERIRLEAPFLEYSPHEQRAIEAGEALVVSDGKPTPAQRQILEAAEAAREALNKRRARQRAFSVSSGNAARVKSMLLMALPHKTHGPDDMDADDFVLNTQSATLHLHPEGDGEGGQVVNVNAKDHARADLISKCAQVAYDKGAACPRWQAFLDYFQPDEEIQGFLQRFMGYCLTGSTAEQKLLFFYGDGANGKSTFIEAICALLGGYAGQLNPESVTGSGQRRGDQATPDLATLVGKRLVRVSELPRGEPVKEELIKALTGGEPMQVRRLHQGFFDMTPIFKAVMSGNDKPYITGTDHGIWRRLLIVPWSVKIPEAERRPLEQVLAEFAAERAGILNWMIEGLAAYVEGGLQVPEAVAGMTDSYRSEMDPIQQFVDQCLIAVPPDDAGQPVAEVTAQTMYNAYKRWCEVSAVKVFTNTLFGRELPKKGIEKINGRIRKYINVRINLPDEVVHVDPPI
ncbi:DNA primase family protein [Polycladidibacter hongkongensis]|uniref:DNA primase family protein n=1 Tax=Polycladidibacter hongkongensis TaxID=1647556 RepID=UPI000833BC29|nr:phage/plasmid primase, P4 family [Pseudovibrio hongkongensis]